MIGVSFSCVFLFLSRKKEESLPSIFIQSDVAAQRIKRMKLGKKIPQKWPYAIVVNVMILQSVVSSCQCVGKA